jgi:hypothetical protein
MLASAEEGRLLLSFLKNKQVVEARNGSCPSLLSKRTRGKPKLKIRPGEG